MKREHVILAVLVGVVLGLHLAVLDYPSSTGYVMDEQYYVPAALAMLNHTPCSPALGELCNLEHPFLGKAFIAAGILIFGNDATGWRVFSVIFGVLCIVLVWFLSKSLLASTLFGFESLVFAHSGLGVLDIPMLFFLMLGFVLYFRNRYLLAGVALGLSLLCKETAMFGILALGIWHLWKSKEKMKGFAYMAAPLFLVFIIGMQLYYSVFTTFPSIINGFAYLLGYAAELRGHSWCAYSIGCVNGPYLNPLNWISYYFPPGYDVFYRGTISVGWRGISTLPVVWLGILGLWFKRKSMSFYGLWFLVGYLPYIPLWLIGRNTYPYYMILVTPALCIAAASLKPRIGDVDFTKLYRAVLLLIVCFWFIATYPLL